MRTTVIAVVAVLALLCFVSIGVEAAGAPVRRLARATAAPAEVGLTPKEICVAKCAAESAVCVYKCEHPGMLGGCKENCAITAAECAAECAFEAEAPVATMVVPESAFTGVKAAEKAAEKELVATTVVPESAFVKAPASSDINGQCMVKCAADAAYCAYECFHQNSTSKVVCDEKCAAEAAECAGTCVDPVQVSAATEKIMALADVAVALVSEPKAQQLSQAVQVNAEPVAECLAECAAEAAYCVFECPVNPSGGMLGGCKEVCAIKAAACTARCVMPPTEKAVTVPAVIDSSNVEAALAAATKVESGIMTPQVSALCLAKCAATGAYCVYQCVHTNGPVGCKTTCGIEAAACAGECVVAPTSQLQLAAISDNVMEAASKAVALVDATPAASSVAVAQVGAPEISPLCLAKCAAEAGVCVYKCLHPGLLGGCKESCALKAAECSGLCLLALPAPQKQVNSDNIVEVFANANKQVAAPANKNTCVFNCVKASSGCADKCHKGDEQCFQNCLDVSAQCCANCYNVHEEEAPVAVTVVPESAFTGVVAAPVASTEIAVGGDGICLAKCAAEAAVCVYKCLHPMGGLLGGCKEDCAITAAECSGECLIAATPAVAAKQLPALTSSAAREVVATASKAVALVEASPAAASPAAVSQVEVGPLTPICLAKCAAEAAVCVYKCEHPSKGLLGGCKEDCALKAAECSGECLL